ncbi:MAG: SDR family oxidoreductase [Proteobacteria bacterium]|nr:SDR family oxidoreductase [Pseudomonadota bacterium]MBI3499088.1 SDR family oxidoreductase [Pseudomonadota bacterium]
MPRIAVCGATGRTGRRLIAHLLATGRDAVAVGRAPARLERIPATIPRRLADMDDRAALRAALADADVVVSCAPAKTVPNLIQALPAGLKRLVVMGSTRRFTRFADSFAAEVIAAEAALGASGLPYVMLHPTLIYGTGEDASLQRVVAYLRRIPVLPLPGGGGLVQPIHVEDVVRALEAAMLVADPPRNGMVIAGPTPMTYASMIRELARARGLKAIIVNIPLAPLLLLARLTALLPGLPTIRPEEVRRIVEDKSFDITEMRERLGVVPMSFAEGLRLGSGEPGAAALPQAANG